MGIAESILSQIEGFHPILRFYVKKAVVSIAYPEQAEGSNHERWTLIFCHITHAGRSE